MFSTILKTKILVFATTLDIAIAISTISSTGTNLKNKILAVHLHDNDQSSDLHLLPFDGTIDWDKLLKHLKNANYQGPVTLESCYIDHYLDRSLEDFYKDSYELAKKLTKN